MLFWFFCYYSSHYYGYHRGRLVGQFGAIAAGPRQHSHSLFRVPRDSWPYFMFSRLSSIVAAIPILNMVSMVTMITAFP
jgi:hypothetical protein